MITKKTEIYICEYCRKVYQIKFFAEKHENMCNRNPDNFRACHSCRYLDKKETKIYSGIDDYYSGDSINNVVNFCYCSSKNIFLYTPQNEIKGNHSHTDIEGGAFENYPMSKECDSRA